MAYHQDQLANIHDEGLNALKTFITNWDSSQFTEPHFTGNQVDRNVVFRLEGEFGFIHDRPAARALIERLASDDAGSETIYCLVTGRQGPLARLHPKIKNVEGTAAAEVPLVSFQQECSQSYNKEQGANAPTSQTAAFRYTSALNFLLTRGGPNRVARPIGDATMLFWADATDVDPDAADAADAWIKAAFDPDALEDAAAMLLKDQLTAIGQGRPLAQVIAPNVEDGLRYYILGLAPNAARLSVRFWEETNVGTLARRIADHYADTTIEPAPFGWVKPPSVGRMLAQTTALQGEFKNIPKLLAGEVMRAVITGAPYPRTLLAATIMRLRAGGPRTKDGGLAEIGWHAAMIRAVLEREARLSHGKKKGAPMGLDKQSSNQAYRLGRLFAALEYVQEQAIEGAKATIRSRFLASASSAPASVFPTLMRLSQHHIVKLTGSTNPRAATFHDRQIQEILDGVPGDFPVSLTLADQGRFYIGYYHQRAERFRKRDDKAAPEVLEQEEGSDGE